jgi:hypothetical protein
MAVTNLPFIQQQMIRYGITAYLALGLMGNILNCIMFTRPLYRRTPSSIYFLSLSILAIIYLIWSIFPLIYTLGHTDPQTQSLVYCKLRLYGSHVLGQCLRYIVVFACIDRFVVTRTNVRIRSLNSVQIAIKVIFIIFGVWLVASIHILIFMDIQRGVCGMFGLYKLIYTIYQTIVTGILPPILMSIFSTLTIRSLYHQHGNRVRARRRDRDFMRMVVAEVIVNIFTSIPYSSNLIYGVIANNIVGKSAQRLEIESFITFLTQFIIYLLSVAPFYLFILTSKPFRNEFIKILAKSWNKITRQQNRIVPLIQQNVSASINDTVVHDRQ